MLMNNFTGEYTNLNLGKVLANDLDDWDVSNKTFQLQNEDNSHFKLEVHVHY